MHRNRRKPLAATIAAALVAVAPVAARAALIEYEFEGIIEQENDLTGYVGATYSLSLVLDTVSGDIGDFSWSVTGKGTWIGSGAYESFSANTMFLDLGTQFGGASYSQLGDTFGVDIAYHSIGGPGATLFGDYVDGFPTSFNLSVATSNSFLVGQSSSVNSFQGRFTSASGTALPTPEPGTAPAVLAGIAALAALRRRKAAA